MVINNKKVVWTINMGKNKMEESTIECYKALIELTTVEKSALYDKIPYGSERKHMMKISEKYELPLEELAIMDIIERIYDEEFQSGIGRSLPFDTQSYQQLFRFITSPQKEDMPFHRSLTSSYMPLFDMGMGVYTERVGTEKMSLFHEKLIETTERKLFDISYLLFEPIREYQSKIALEGIGKLEGMLPLHMAEIRSTEPTWKPGEYGE